MRVTFQNLPVHKRAGVALICVAHHVLWCTLCLVSEFPLQTGWKTCPTTTPQLGIQNGLNDVFRGHLGQDFCQCRVAIGSYVILDVTGINLANVLQNDADLFVFWFPYLFIHEVAHLCTVLCKFTTFNEMFNHQGTNTLRRQGNIVAAFRVDQDIWSFGFGVADPRTIEDLDLIQNFLQFQLFDDLLFNLKGAFLDTNRIHRNKNR